jgi:hypothetical protein
MDIVNAVQTDPQILILFISLLVGFISIILTVVTLMWQRKHDRLSVRPIPVISINNLGSEINIPLENCGVGPLIIRQILIGRYDEQNQVKFDEWVPEEFPKRQPHVVTVLHTLPFNSALSQGCKQNLLYCKINPSSQEQRIELNSIREELRKIIAFRVIYTDIYESIIWDSYSKVSIESFAHISPENERYFIEYPKC